MSYYEGMPFFLCLVPVLLIAFILGYLEQPLRWYGLAASVFFALCVFSGDPEQLFYLAVFLAWSLLLIYLYLRIRGKYGRKAGIYHAAVLLALAPLILCKVTPLLPLNQLRPLKWLLSQLSQSQMSALSAQDQEVSQLTLNLFAFTGVSYLTFRVVQILIETYDGVIKEIHFAETVSFLLFFPSLSSGPIDRSRRFGEDWSRTLLREQYLELCGRGLWKLLLGAVYKMVLAAFAYRAMGYLENSAVWYCVAGYAYAYGVYLFFDFAGYSLMAIGTANILGVELPENFRQPYLAVDIRDFWNRWHITLSHWFRDFIFTRFIMYSAKKKWFGSRLQRAGAGFFVNMTIMGFWHGVDASYILYGLYHGALLAATEVYQKKSGFYKKNKKKRWYQLLSWFLTLQLVLFGFLIFSGQLLKILTGFS